MNPAGFHAFLGDDVFEIPFLEHTTQSAMQIFLCLIIRRNVQSKCQREEAGLFKANFSTNNWQLHSNA
jgi:hypothetical protein